MLNIPTKFEGILKKLKFVVKFRSFKWFQALIDNLHYYGVEMYEIYQKTILVCKHNGLAMVNIYRDYFHFT